MQTLAHISDRIPYGIYSSVLCFNRNEWARIIQKHGAVYAFQLARIWGSAGAVDLLVQLLTPGVIHAKGYVRLAFCLKEGARLGHAVRQISAATKEPEIVQRRIRPLADLQMNMDRREAFHQVRINKSWNAFTMVRILYRWKLECITSKYEEVVRQGNARESIQEGIFDHKTFVRNQCRWVEETFLDGMFQPAQSDAPLIELRRCDVGPGTNDGTVQRLKDSLDQIRLSCSWRANQQEAPLFTDEIQNDLLNINLPLEEVGDLWEEVGAPSFTVQDGLVVLYSGSLAVQCPKHLPLSGIF